MDKDNMPHHIAIVMDGNGRWAKREGKPILAGHDAGMKAMKEIVKRSSVLGVKHLTVYAFSTENWKRSKSEVSGIFGLVVKYVESELEELYDNNVVVSIIGDYEKLPNAAVKALKRALDRTKTNTGLGFHIALNYGSRAEIAGAATRAMQGYVDAGYGQFEITEDDIKSQLFTSDTPDPDLVIRTSGEKRLSNFLLWQSAYSEFVFTDVLWPDFTPEEYERCIEEYRSRQRRYGGR